MAAHIALHVVSRERWQSWWPQFSQIRVTGKAACPVKTFDLNSTWWTLQRIAFQAVPADAVLEHAEATSASSVSDSVGSWVEAARSGHHSSWVRTAGSSHHSKLCKHSKTLRCDSLNLGTTRNKEGEVVKTVTGRIDLCAVEETRWYGGICKSQNRMAISEDSHYKFFWTDNKEEKAGVGILLVEYWVVNVFYVVRIFDWILFLKLAIGTDIYTITSVYTQVWLPRCRQGQLLWRAASCSCRNSYLRDRFSPS